MKIALAIAGVVALALTGTQPIAADITGSPPISAVTVQIASENNSGQTGTATLSPTIDNKTQVVIQLKGEPPGAQEPTHIHSGTCKKPDPNASWVLTPISGGMSTTTINATLPSILAGHYAINVHLSEMHYGTYLACGNIPSVKVPSGAGPTPVRTPAPVATYKPAP